MPPPDLNVDPVPLGAAAAAVAAALAALPAPGLDPADLAVLIGLPGGAALVDEHDRLAAAVRGRLRELLAVVDGLGSAADRAAAAERQAVASIRAVAG